MSGLDTFDLILAEGR